MKIYITNTYKFPKEGWGRKMFEFQKKYKGFEITIFYITLYIGQRI